MIKLSRPCQQNRDFYPQVAQLLQFHRIGEVALVGFTPRVYRVFWWLMWQVSAAAGYTPRSYLIQFSELVCHGRHA